MSTVAAFVEPPSPLPWSLRPLLALGAHLAGEELLPAKLLTHLPRFAVAVGLVEATAPSAPGDLDARSLAIARIVASATAGCPFCLDMNAATWRRAGLSREDVAAFAGWDDTHAERVGAREALIARYASALSRTPVDVDEDLVSRLRAELSDRGLVALAAAVALVNFWSRFNQGLGVPSAGLAAASGCPLPDAPRSVPPR